MPEEMQVFLELSEEVQMLLDRQGINLYTELQQEIPALHVRQGADPWSPEGSRSIVQILFGTAAVISALTPTILGILRAITPPDRTTNWEIEEVETRSPDGSVTTQRKQIRAQGEQRPWPTLFPPTSTPLSSDTTTPLLDDKEKEI